MLFFEERVGLFPVVLLTLAFRSWLVGKKRRDFKFPFCIDLCCLGHKLFPLFHLWFTSDSVYSFLMVSILFSSILAAKRNLDLYSWSRRFKICFESQTE